MNNKIYKRILKEVSYILNGNLTIRQIASILNVSKSTVHKDLHERLYYIDKETFKKVNIVLKKHLENRHINGGNATKIKYEKIRKGMISC
ncbi:MAG: sporulation transcriptional regulator SpoIIID [Bacilli bacterium]|nr:sporulation transcriptional regulator SpoIIID [Bacilli bacterium]